MTRKSISIISTIFLITSLCLSSFGCNLFSPIVGKWQDTRTQDTYEFTSTGDFIIKSNGTVMAGTYELVGSDVVKIRLEGLAGGMLSAFGADSWVYNISGNTMTYTAAGQTVTLQRLGGSVSTPAASNPPNATKTSPTSTTGYQLTSSVVPTGGGTISPSSGTFKGGSPVTLLATPAQYYKFVGWAGDTSGNASPLTINMNSNKQIVAQFSKITYNIQLQSNPSEGGTLRSDIGVFEAGNTARITATAASGYRFVQWGTDASGNTNPLSILINRNEVISANFIKQYKLTVSADSKSGTVSPNGSIYDAGTPVNITAVPLFPYAFKSWVGADDNNVISSKVTMNSDKSVSAVFVKLPEKLQMPSGGNTYGTKVIPIDLHQSEWVDGTIACDTALPAQTVYIQGPDGKIIKDLGRPGFATFQFQAPVDGKYSIVIQANYISTWGTNYHIECTIYGLP